jgi:hypothetical protein
LKKDFADSGGTGLRLLVAVQSKRAAQQRGSFGGNQSVKSALNLQNLRF